MQEDRHMQSISEKTHAEQSSTKSVSRFFDQYRLGSALRNAGASKQKGVLASTILKYLIALIYTGKSMFQDMRSATPFAQGFRKDAVYRLLNLSTVNWRAFLLVVARRVKDDMERLTSQARRCAFIVDDTMFAIRYAEKSELVSKVYDHAEKGRNKYKWGFRMLSLCWSDGVSLIPLAFRHLASADEKNQRCGVKARLDKRSLAYRIRKEAVSKAPEVLLGMLKAALKAGINASYVIFDSWFSFPATIIKLHGLNLHTVSRVKDTTKIKYLVHGEKKTAKEIFKANKKRRGKSRYQLSVPVILYSTEGKETITLGAKLVYVRNRQKRNDWIALVSTDLSLSEEDIIALYGKRWDIEVFFKVCKSYLKLTGEFQQLSYDALTAHTTIVMIRYMMLSVEKRSQEDPRSLGELFYHGFDEISDIQFEQSLLMIMELLADILKDDDLGLTDAQVECILDRFLKNLPTNIQNCLLQDFAA